MKNIYCPKCGGIVPGLEEFEFNLYNLAYKKCVDATKEYRSTYQATLGQTPVNELHKPAKEKYTELTGWECKSSDTLHLWVKHRVSSFPLHCKPCDLYYRAPKTGKCPQCGVSSNA